MTRAGMGVLAILLLAPFVGAAGETRFYERITVNCSRKPLLEALASVPTVVYAYFALTFVTLTVLRPIFGDSISIFNALGASTVMAVMLIPTIASISEDAMASVPRELREGAFVVSIAMVEAVTQRQVAVR